MTDRDPAFLWETEAMRSASHRVSEREADEFTPNGNDRWVTLREASRTTSIPVETLRKWARRSSVPSYLTPTRQGVSLRMVDLDAVRQRAIELGRDEVPVPTQKAYVDQGTSAPAGTATPSPTEPPVPPGSMIIPVDAWNKMLTQLGNLHEAGQQLAEARERAAKAETEAQFLRERLAELRREETPDPTRPAPETPTTTVAAAAPSVPMHQRTWRYVVDKWQERRQG